MALTLQERANLSKGTAINQLSILPVTPTEKIDAQLKKIAGELITGELLSSAIPNIATFAPSDGQLREWCNRVLDSSSMANRMTPAIISANQWDTDGVEIVDAAIRNTCLNNIAAFAAKI